MFVNASFKMVLKVATIAEKNIKIEQKPMIRNQCFAVFTGK